MIKKFLNLKKGESGITLIALVITIIVLLILAGVSIATLTGSNGLLTRANEAKMATTEAGAKEKVQIEVAGSFDNSGNFDIDKLKENLKANLGLQNDDIKENEDGSITVTVDGYEVTVDSKGNVLLGGETGTEIDKKSFITEWTVKQGDVIYLPISIGYIGDNNFIVDWGDGSERETINDSEEVLESLPNHQYKEDGTYQISITGKCSYFTFSTVNENYPEQSAKMTKLVSWGEIEAKAYEFTDGTGIQGKIPSPTENTFAKIKQNGFNYMFLGCSSITDIPNDLFANIPENITSFEETFNECISLKSIPKDLFKNAINVQSFEHTFSECTNLNSIPEDLFKNATNVQTFKETFRTCTSLNSIPNDLFKNATNVQDFYQTFGYCAALKSVPEGLFDNNQEVTNFERVFYRCTGLETVPLNLFDNNNKATNFQDAFYQNELITTGPRLWEKSTEGLNGLYCYGRCDTFDTTGLSEDILNVWFKEHE